MGWTMIDHRPEGESHEEFFAREVLGKRQEILASAHVAGIGGTFYAAVRQKDSGEVWALVVLTTGRAGSRFGYKEMEESQGPVPCECPAHVLDLLSPTTSEHALEWRSRCRARLRHLAAVIPGARVRFELDFLTPEGPVGRSRLSTPPRATFAVPRRRSTASPAGGGRASRSSPPRKRADGALRGRGRRRGGRR